MSLPGDRAAAAAPIDWGKQNLADLTQTRVGPADPLDQPGQAVPAAAGHRASARWFGAGFPDYPWIFATDGEYTAFAAMALGQFQTAEDHLRTLRDISDVLNDRSGIVVHETVSDGSVYFGHDSQTTNRTTAPRRTTSTPTRRSSSRASSRSIWRWTGDDGFRDEMYDFAKRNLHAVDQRLDVDHDGWPEGSGNVERPGMGPEKLDNAVYYIRALLDLADMARVEARRRHGAWATGLARKLQRQFETTWWDATDQQYADSLIDPGNQSVVPEALDRPGADGGRARPATAQATPGVARATTTAPPRSRGARTRATAATGPAAAASSTPAAAAATTARATSRSSR